MKLIDLDRALKRTVKNIVVNTNNTTKETAFEIVRVLIPATPVDTGLARGNWQGSLGGSNSGTVDTKSKESQRQVRRLLNVIKGRKEGQSIHIRNNLPYIKPLNMGHSKQAPAAFVELAVETGRRKVKTAKLLKK